MSKVNKIIEGLRQAAAGDFGRVTIMGQKWVRDKNSEIVRLRAALVQIREVCDDNAPRDCDKGMALKFVRQVAAKAMAK